MRTWQPAGSCPQATYFDLHTLKRNSSEPFTVGSLYKRRDVEDTVLISHSSILIFRLDSDCQGRSWPTSKVD